jgi:hypothetical protein
LKNAASATPSMKARLKRCPRRATHRHCQLPDGEEIRKLGLIRNSVFPYLPALPFGSAPILPY